MTETSPYPKFLRRPPMIRDCRFDPQRLAPFEECMRVFGMGDHDPHGEWPRNVLSRKAVAFSCGRLARRGEHLEHNHDPGELELCRRLSVRAAQIVAGVRAGSGSGEASEFHPFFVAANAGDPVPDRVTPGVMRAAFGGTIHPDAQILVEPLAQCGVWWRCVLDWYALESENRSGRLVNPWTELMAWFQAHPDLHAPAFVMIGSAPLDPEVCTGGCIFPRLAVAITSGGSQVGVAGWTSSA